MLVYRTEMIHERVAHHKGIEILDFLFTAFVLLILCSVLVVNDEVIEHIRVLIRFQRRK